MADLSPAAQAVLDAYRSSHLSINNLAAALRAAAEQVAPEAEFYPGTCCERELKAVRSDLLAIATELEAQ